MRYLTTPQAAEYAGVKIRTLQSWRSNGNGPCYFKRAGRCLYKPSDIDSWIEATARTSTKEVIQ